MLRIGIASGAGALILTALYFFPGRLIFKYRDRLKAEFQSSQEQLQTSHELVRSFTNPQKAIEDIEQKSRELKEMGATTRQLPRIVQSLAQPASRLGVNVASIRPREDIKTNEDNLPPGISKTYIELVMTCPYKIFAEYLKAVSELPTTFIVERLSMEKTKEGAAPYEGDKAADKPKGAPQELVVTLTVSTYLVWEI